MILPHDANPDSDEIFGRDRSPRTSLGKWSPQRPDVYPRGTHRHGIASQFPMFFLGQRTSILNNVQRACSSSPARSYYGEACWLGMKLGSAARVTRSERFFRITAGLDADKQDLERYPVTKGLQESVQAFKAIDAEIELQPILDYLASRELREAGSGNVPTRDGKC